MEVVEEYQRREPASQEDQEEQDAGNVSGGTSPDGTGTQELMSDMVYTENGQIKARKPYTITKQREKWTDEEHLRFLDALKLHGRAWRKIEDHIRTKTAVQIRSHAQKFFSKLEKKKEVGDASPPEEVINIPPPRPKRRPSRPYPRKETAQETSGNGDAGRTTAADNAASNKPANPVASVAQRQPATTANTAAGPEVTDATVAAVAAAASAAAAAAAAAVVAAAGQQVQAHLQANPPQGFPFFGMPPSVLAQYTALHAPQLEVLAQKGGPNGWLTRPAPRTGNPGTQNEADKSLQDRVWQQMQSNLQSMAEATATTDGGTREVSISVQTNSSDGDSACSRETANTENDAQAQAGWHARPPRQVRPSMPLRPVSSRPAGDGQVPATYLQLLAGLRDAAKSSAHPAPAPLGVEHAARRKLEGTKGSHNSGSSGRKPAGAEEAGTQQASGSGNALAEPYSDEARAGAASPREPHSPSIQEVAVKQPSDQTNASGSNQTNGSGGNHLHKKVPADKDPARREARGSLPTTNASVYGGNATGNLHSSAGNGKGHNAAKNDGSSGNVNGSSGNGGQRSSGDGNGSSGNGNGSSGNGDGSSGNANGSSGNGNGSSGNANGSSGTAKGSNGNVNGSNGDTSGGRQNSVKDSTNGDRNGYSYGNTPSTSLPHASPTFERHGSAGTLGVPPHYAAGTNPCIISLAPHVALQQESANAQAILVALQAQATLGHSLMAYHATPALLHGLIPQHTAFPSSAGLQPGQMDAAGMAAFCQQLMAAAAMSRPGGMLPAGGLPPTGSALEVETFEALMACAAGAVLPLMQQQPPQQPPAQLQQPQLQLQQLQQAQAQLQQLQPPQPQLQQLQQPQPPQPQLQQLQQPSEVAQAAAAPPAATEAPPPAAADAGGANQRGGDKRAGTQIEHIPPPKKRAMQ